MTATRFPTRPAAPIPAYAFALAADDARASLLVLMDEGTDQLDEFIGVTVAAPSVTAVTIYSLAKMTGQPQRTVRDRVNKLEAEGWLVSEHKGSCGVLIRELKPTPELDAKIRRRMAARIEAARALLRNVEAAGSGTGLAA